MKRDRDQSDAPRSRSSEGGAKAQRDGSSNDTVPSARSDDNRYEKITPCSVVIQRLSEVTLRKLIQQGSNTTSKKLSHHRKDAGSSLVANLAAGEAQVGRDAVRPKKNRAAHVPRKTRSKQGAEKGSLCRKDSCPTFPRRVDEVSLRSEELSDIINFLIETDPEGRKDDYVKVIQDTNSALLSSKPEVYAFAYDPKMTLSDCEEKDQKRDDGHHANEWSALGSSSPDPDGIGEVTTPSSREGCCVVVPRCSSDENALQSKQAQSFESLISTSDSEGRLVIDEGDDVTPDNACLAEAYRGSRNCVSVSENWLTEGGDEAGPTLAAVAHAKEDRSSPTRSCSNVAPCVIENGHSDAEPCGDVPVKGANCNMSPLKIPQSKAQQRSPATDTKKGCDDAEELVWLPYISHTMSLPEADNLDAKATSPASELKGKNGMGGSPTTKVVSRRARFDSPSEKHRKESSLRKEREQPKRLCRSHSADGAEAKSSQFLTVYTTVRDGRITSVDCKRYRKKHRRSVSRDRACSRLSPERDCNASKRSVSKATIQSVGEDNKRPCSKSTPQSESKQSKQPSKHKKEVDVYVSVSKVVRDMVNATVRDVQDVRNDRDITDPNLKHLFRAFCDTNGYKYEDFMNEGAEHTSPRVLKPDAGEPRGTRKRHHHSNNRHFTGELASTLPRLMPSPKKRRKVKPLPEGKRILTRSQFRKARHEKDRHERQDSFSATQGSKAKTRVPTTGPDLYSSNTESSVDLSEAIATLEISSDSGNGPVSRAERTGETMVMSVETETPSYDIELSPEKQTDDGKHYSFTDATHGTKESKHRESIFVPRSDECIESDFDEDRLVICDSESETETEISCSGVRTGAESETAVPSDESVTLVSEETAVVPPFCDSADETVTCVSDVSVKEFDEGRTEKEESSVVEKVVEELLQHCDRNNAAGSATGEKTGAGHEEQSSGDSCPHTSEEAILEGPEQEYEMCSFRNRSYSADTETQDLNEPIPEDEFGAGSFFGDVVTKQEPEERTENSLVLDVELEDQSEIGPLREVPEGSRNTLESSDPTDMLDEKSVNGYALCSMKVKQEMCLEESTAPYHIDSVLPEDESTMELPEDDNAEELSEENCGKEREGHYVVHDIRDDNSYDKDSVGAANAKVQEGDEVKAETKELFAKEDILEDSPVDPPAVENVDCFGIASGSPENVQLDECRIHCSVDMKGEPATDDCVVMDALDEHPLDLTLRELAAAKPKQDVPVGTVHPQQSITDDRSVTRHTLDTVDAAPINFSFSGADCRKAGFKPSHIPPSKQEKPNNPDTARSEKGSSESILQRLLLDNTKNDKTPDSGTPMPVIIDVRSLRPELEAAQRQLSPNTVATTNAARHDPRQQQMSPAGPRQVMKASVTVAPMTYTENHRALESKVLEIKKQIHHLTILATYKEKELGCIRNLRLAKEEALKQLECKYPAMFSYSTANRSCGQSLGTTSYAEVQEMVTKAVTFSSAVECEHSFSAAHQPTAFREVHPSNQPSGNDSGASGFRKIAPKQQPSCPSTTEDTRRQQSTGFAAPYWIPNILASAELSSGTLKHAVKQGLVAPQPAYQLPMFVPWRSQHSSSDSGVMYSDVSREQSSISPSSVLDCNSTQARTTHPVSPLSHTKQTFTETQRSSTVSDSEDSVQRTSRTFRRDAHASARSSADMYAGHSSVSSDQIVDVESALQNQALHMYAQMLHANRERDAADIASLLRDRQLAMGHAPSQTRAFCNAMDTWMRLSQNVPDGYADNSMASRKNDPKVQLWNQPHATMRAGKED